MNKTRIAIAIAVAFTAGAGLDHGFSAVAAQAYAPPQVVEAQSFVLKDAKGARRAELTVRLDGTAALEFYDRSGNVIWTAPGIRPIPAR